MARQPVLKPRREILYLFDYLLLKFFASFAPFCGYSLMPSTKASSAPRSGAAKLGSATMSVASRDRPSSGKVMDAVSIKRADMVVRINRS